MLRLLVLHCNGPEQPKGSKGCACPCNQRTGGHEKRQIGHTGQSEAVCTIEHDRMKTSDMSTHLVVSNTVAVFTSCEFDESQAAKNLASGFTARKQNYKTAHVKGSNELTQPDCPQKSKRGRCCPGTNFEASRSAHGSWGSSYGC